MKEQTQHIENIPTGIQIKNNTVVFTAQIQEHNVPPGTLYLITPQPRGNQISLIPAITKKTNEIQQTTLITTHEITKQRGYTDLILENTKNITLWGPLSNTIDITKITGKTLWYLSPRDAYIETIIPKYKQPTTNIKHDNKTHTTLEKYHIINNTKNTKQINKDIEKHTATTLFISNDIQNKTNANINIYTIHSLENIICGIGMCQCCVEIIKEKPNTICLKGIFIKQEN